MFLPEPEGSNREPVPPPHNPEPYPKAAPHYDQKSGSNDISHPDPEERQYCVYAGFQLIALGRLYFLSPDIFFR